MTNLERLTKLLKQIGFSDRVPAELAQDLLDGGLDFVAPPETNAAVDPDYEYPADSVSQACVTGPQGPHQGHE